MRPFKFQCKYCDRKYKTERGMTQHTCKEQERVDELKTVLGQTAYENYCTWNKMRGHRIPTIDVYATSTYYTLFKKFTKFISDVKISNTPSYIKLMVRMNLEPSMWTHQLTYKAYIEYMDNEVEPLEHVKTTAYTIIDYCISHNVDSSEFFNIIPPNEFIQYILRRQLSPWVLFNSMKFIEYYDSSLNMEHLATFTGIYPPREWASTFNKHKNEVAKIKSVVNELGI